MALTLCPKRWLIVYSQWENWYAYDPIDSGRVTWVWH